MLHTSAKQDPRVLGVFRADCADLRKYSVVSAYTSAPTSPTLFTPLYTIFSSSRILAHSHFSGRSFHSAAAVELYRSYQIMQEAEQAASYRPVPCGCAPPPCRGAPVTAVLFHLLQACLALHRG